MIVLGKAGRNFAAGMSGGIAYVLDENGDFAEKRCNPASVDLEPLGEAEDNESLHADREARRIAPGARAAQWVLENWGQMLPKFVKVFPQEYKRVLGSAASGRHQSAAAHAEAKPDPGAMGKITGFMEYTRETAPRRPPAERVNDWFEIYLPFPEAETAHASRPLHGLRRAFLPHRLPAEQPHS